MFINDIHSGIFNSNDDKAMLHRFSHHYSLLTWYQLFSTVTIFVFLVYIHLYGSLEFHRLLGLNVLDEINDTVGVTIFVVVP